LWSWRTRRMSCSSVRGRRPVQGRTLRSLLSSCVLSATPYRLRLSWCGGRRLGLSSGSLFRRGFPSLRRLSISAYRSPLCVRGWTEASLSGLMVRSPFSWGVTAFAGLADSCRSYASGDKTETGCKPWSIYWRTRSRCSVLGSSKGWTSSSAAGSSLPSWWRTPSLSSRGCALPLRGSAGRSAVAMTLPFKRSRGQAVGREESDWLLRLRAISRCVSGRSTELGV
jgi:hypothetical protein